MNLTSDPTIPSKQPASSLPEILRRDQPMQRLTPTEEKAPAVPHGNPRTELRLVKKPRPIQKVWIDLDNSPHVPFFRPIMEELERRGFQVILTARDCFQVCELADLAGLKYRKVGRHYGKNRLAKVMGLAIRVLQLAPFILREKPAISVSHGSRSLIVLSALLGIRNVTIADYEHADLRLTNWLGSEQKKWFMTPEIISSAVYEKRGMRKDHILQYPGIKEDVYVPFFRPDEGLKQSLGFAASDVLVTLRPPASEAHYHNPESEELLAAVLEMLHQRPDVRTVLLPRTPKQESELRQAKPELFAAGRIVVPQHALDGLDLIWNSDVVISGGGTMNREAAALGVPVYSLFRGTLGAVDKHLSERGKLVLLQSAQDVRDNLKLVHRDQTQDAAPGHATALDAVVNHLQAILENRG